MSFAASRRLPRSCPLLRSTYPPAPVIPLMPRRGRRPNWSHLDGVAVNGTAKAVDPAAGRDIEPCVFCRFVPRVRFARSRPTKRLPLGAEVSSNPKCGAPGQTDRRVHDDRSALVDQAGALSELSAAANLMELIAYQCEELVANLFGKIGLESKLPRASRDGAWTAQRWIQCRLRAAK